MAKGINLGSMRFDADTAGRSRVMSAWLGLIAAALRRGGDVRYAEYRARIERTGPIGLV